MDTTRILENAERVEAELERLRAARPALSSRISRAESILVTQLSVSNGRRPIKVRIHPDGDHTYVIRSGSKLSKEYTVNPHVWSCDCPDHRRRGRGCKHGLACYVLERASRKRPTPLRTGTGEDLPVEDLEHVSEIVPRALSNVADNDSLRGVVPLDVVAAGLERMGD